MPEIMITAYVKPEWLGEVDSADGMTPKQELMAYVIEFLPIIACKVLNEARRESPRFQRAIGVAQVGLVVLPIHHWSRNMSDLAVEVRFDGIDGDEKDPMERRWSLARDISGGLFGHVDENMFIQQMLHGLSYSVDCVLLPSSGIVRHSGTGHDKWGVPVYDKV